MAQCVLVRAARRRAQATRSGLIILAASCLISAPGAAAGPPDCSSASPGSCRSALEQALLPFWKRLPDRAGWRMMMSPAFPLVWPAPDARSTVVHYAFAMRLDPAVADGAEMTAPWARTLLDADGVIHVEQLSPHLNPLGMQGVRPLRSEEIALAGREEEAAERLLAGGEQATGGLVREVTCGWIGRQGVVASAITPRHQSFMRWLDCPGLARR